MGAAAGEAPSLVVWNLLTVSVWWSAAVLTSALAVDATHGIFAVAVPPQPVRRLTAAGSGDIAALQLGQTRANNDAAQTITGHAASRGAGTGNAASSAGGMAAVDGPLINGYGGASPRVNGTANSVSSSPNDIGLSANQPASAAPQPGSAALGDASRALEQLGQVSDQLSSLACPGGAVWYERAGVVGMEQPQQQHPPQTNGQEASADQRDVVYGGGGGTVLLFGPGSPLPKEAWMLPR